MKEAMVSKVADGAVDLLATDHCAFSKQDKDAPVTSVREVPNGLAGIGALPHLAAKLFVGRTAEPVLEMARHLSANPARLLGVFPKKGSIRVGSDADLVIGRIGDEDHEIRSSLADVHETYPGITSRLETQHVFLRGREVVRNGRLINSDERTGKPLWPV